MRIERGDRKDYERLLEIWEESVRATHDFITEGDIEEYRSMIMEYAFPGVDLWCAVDDEGIHGFIGVAEGNIEMLFVEPGSFKKGMGRALLTHAVEELGATKVDVNEQNPGACEFYKHMGFKVVKRSPLDSQGKPFPILHLELER